MSTRVGVLVCMLVEYRSRIGWGRADEGTPRWGDKEGVFRACRDLCALPTL